MAKTGQRWFLNSQHQLNSFVEYVQGQWAQSKSPVVEFIAKDRTENQNAMFYALYRDIANAMQDKTAIEVKRDCKLRYGVVLRKMADPEWAAFYDEHIKPMGFEGKLMLMDDLPITSTFSKKQASDYIESILSDYTRQGVQIPDPRHEGM